MTRRRPAVDCWSIRLHCLLYRVGLSCGVGDAVKYQSERLLRHKVAYRALTHERVVLREIRTLGHDDYRAAAISWAGRSERLLDGSGFALVGNDNRGGGEGGEQRRDAISFTERKNRVASLAEPPLQVSPHRVVSKTN